ncbi:MAG: anaerobic ribonucleoside-triphosphate reductase activating protein [Clostridia bacterium]|nr:anaerobic ribonucleoside-triphosphate reductase activating protein [Clostridia bacterium]
MIIYGLQKLSLLDYPGKTACTVFTGGCNFRCPYCHNASLVVGLNEVEPVDNDTFFAFLHKRRNILDGVCVTGGEPLLQPDIEDFFREIKKRGYCVKLDTNGSFPEMLKHLVDERLVDYVAMDIKNSPEKYSLTAGISELDFSKINESVEFLLSSAVDYEFRTTVVKELHSKDDFALIGEWIKGARRYFIQSFTDSGDILGGSFSAYGKNELEDIRDLMKQYVSETQIRGI